MSSIVQETQKKTAATTKQPARHWLIICRPFDVRLPERLNGCRSFLPSGSLQRSRSPGQPPWPWERLPLPGGCG